MTDPADHIPYRLLMIYMNIFITGHMDTGELL